MNKRAGRTVHNPCITREVMNNCCLVLIFCVPLGGGGYFFFKPNRFITRFITLKKSLCFCCKSGIKGWSLL